MFNCREGRMFEWITKMLCSCFVCSTQYILHKLSVYVSFRLKFDNWERCNVGWKLVCMFCAQDHDLSLWPYIQSSHAHIRNRLNDGINWVQDRERLFFSERWDGSCTCPAMCFKWNDNFWTIKCQGVENILVAWSENQNSLLNFLLFFFLWIAFDRFSLFIYACFNIFLF